MSIRGVIMHPVTQTIIFVAAVCGLAILLWMIVYGIW